MDLKKACNLVGCTYKNTHVHRDGYTGKQTYTEPAYRHAHMLACMLTFNLLFYPQDVDVCLMLLDLFLVILILDCRVLFHVCHHLRYVTEIRRYVMLVLPLCLL